MATINQIAYFRVKEDQRHNVMSEIEQRRHNVVTEANDLYRTERSYQSSIYAADKNYAGTVYSADSKERSARYSADTAAAASRYVADTNYASNKYASDLNYAANIYKADKTYESSMYNANRSYDAAIYKADRSLEASQRTAQINRETSLRNVATQTKAQRTVANINANSAKRVKEMDLRYQKERMAQDKMIALSQQEVDRYKANMDYAAKIGVAKINYASKQQSTETQAAASITSSFFSVIGSMVGGIAKAAAMA